MSMMCMSKVGMLSKGRTLETGGGKGVRLPTDGVPLSKVSKSGDDPSRRQARELQYSTGAISSRMKDGR